MHNSTIYLGRDLLNTAGYNTSCAISCWIQQCVWGNERMSMTCTLRYRVWAAHLPRKVWIPTWTESRARLRRTSRLSACGNSPSSSSTTTCHPRAPSRRCCTSLSSKCWRHLSEAASKMATWAVYSPTGHPWRTMQWSPFTVTFAPVCRMDTWRKRSLQRLKSPP